MKGFVTKQLNKTYLLIKVMKKILYLIIFLTLLSIAHSIDCPANYNNKDVSFNLVDDGPVTYNGESTTGSDGSTGYICKYEHIKTETITCKGRLEIELLCKGKTSTTVQSSQRIEFSVMYIEEKNKDILFKFQETNTDYKKYCRDHTEWIGTTYHDTEVEGDYVYVKTYVSNKDSVGDFSDFAKKLADQARDSAMDCDAYVKAPDGRMLPRWMVTTADANSYTEENPEAGSIVPDERNSERAEVASGGKSGGLGEWIRGLIFGKRKQIPKEELDPALVEDVGEEEARRIQQQRELGQKAKKMQDQELTDNGPDEPSESGSPQDERKESGFGAWLREKFFGKKKK